MNKNKCWTKLCFLQKNSLTKILFSVLFLFPNFLYVNFVASSICNLFLTKKFSQFQMNTYQAWIILSLQSNCLSLDWALAQPSLLIKVLLLTALHLGFSAFVDCAPSCIFRLAENLTSFVFQDGAIKWYHLINSVVSILV